MRLAIEADIAALTALIDCSVRRLQAANYSAAQIDGALGRVFGCGGWSKRRTLFGSDHQAGREDDLLNPAVDAAKIRAFFVHPDWARRGIGSRISKTCEKAAEDAGFQNFELGVTLTGVALHNGTVLPIVKMLKVMVC